MVAETRIGRPRSARSDAANALLSQKRHEVLQSLAGVDAALNRGKSLAYQPVEFEQGVAEGLAIALSQRRKQAEKDQPTEQVGSAVQRGLLMELVKGLSLGNAVQARSPGWHDDYQTPLC